MIKLSSSEIISLHIAFLERDISINERDNPEEYSFYQPYLNGQEIVDVQVSDGQKVRLHPKITSLGIPSIYIVPLKS